MMIRPMLAAVALAAFATPALAQDGTMYPMEAPAEPDAIPLGTGGVEDKSVEVQIPAGIDMGQVLRVNGQGLPGDPGR